MAERFAQYQQNWSPELKAPCLLFSPLVRWDLVAEWELQVPESTAGMSLVLCITDNLY